MRTNWGYHQRSCLSCGRLFRFLLLGRHRREGVSHTGPGGCHRIGVHCGAVETLIAEVEAAGEPERAGGPVGEPFDGGFWLEREEVESDG